MTRTREPYKGIPGLFPGTGNWIQYWREHPDEQENMVKWLKEQEKQMAGPFVKQDTTKREKLEKDLEDLFSEYAIGPFLIHLAQILAKHEVSMRAYGDDILVRFKNGDRYYIEDEELLGMTGMDSETLHYVREAVLDNRLKEQQH